MALSTVARYLTAQSRPPVRLAAQPPLPVDWYRRSTLFLRHPHADHRKHHMKRQSPFAENAPTVILQP